MSYELITDAQYASLPLEPHLRFASFEAIVRARMTELTMESNSNESYRFIRMQYMSMVAGAADTLNISDIRFPDHLNDPGDGLDDFLHAVSRQVAAIKLSPQSANEYSVMLVAGSRVKIEKEIQNLKTIILNSDLSSDKQNTLLSKLEELRTELSQTRVRMALVASVLAVVAGGIVEGTQFLAEAPHAIATIHSILGHDKESEQAALKRLTPPPARPRLSSTTHSKPSSSSGKARPSREIVEDDIPF